MFGKTQREIVVTGFCFSIVANRRPKAFSKSNSVTGASLEFYDIFQKSYSVKNLGADASEKLRLVKVLQIFPFKKKPNSLARKQEYSKSKPEPEFEP